MTPGTVESLAKMQHARPKLLGTSTQHGAPLQQQTRQSVYQSAWRDKCDDHDGKSFKEAAPLAAAIPARRFVIKVLHDALNVDDIIGVQADGDPFAVQEVRNSAILSHLTDITQDLRLWLRRRLQRDRRYFTARPLRLWLRLRLANKAMAKDSMSSAG